VMTLRSNQAVPLLWAKALTAVGLMRVSMGPPVGGPLRSR
jgi:hypothetical protein